MALTKSIEGVSQSVERDVMRVTAAAADARTPEATDVFLWSQQRVSTAAGGSVCCAAELTRRLVEILPQCCTQNMTSISPATMLPAHKT